MGVDMPEILGTENDDIIIGTAGDDTIRGLGGGDSVFIAGLSLTDISGLSLLL